jgi:signal peptide peptidase SppA
MTINPIMSTFHNQPALVAAEMQGQFESCLFQAHAILTRIEADQSAPLMADDFWFDSNDWRATYRPYIVKNGILMIPIKGVLLHDFGYQLGSWATGYAYIQKAFDRGMADGDVKGIALICDTPGGHVAGNFELVDRMFAMRGVKPIRGYAAESAYSAGYSIISVADNVTVTRTGGVGSIGVLTAHMDMSKAMDSFGMKITFIFAGKHKVDGNPYEALPADVKARIQERIDELYSVFVSTVARNRAMDEQAVRDTEALTFTATQAVSNGLADSIGTLDDAIAVFVADISNDEDEEMATQEKSSADQAAVVDTARADGVIQGKKDGHVEGMAAQKTRINGILACDAAKVRPLAAMAAALDSDMSVEQATAFLAKLPEEKAPVATTTETKPTAGKEFAEHMNKTDHPNVGSVSEASGGEKGSRAERAFASGNYKKPKAA